MDATLADHGILADRTQLIPTQQDEFSQTWAKHVAEQQVRAIGMSGSVVMSLPTSANFSVTTELITLPNWSAGSRPPIIFAMPQYGSVVIYKQFQDSIPLLTQQDPNWVGGNLPLFRTYIVDLENMGSAWRFSIKHDVGVPQNRTWIRDIGISKQWFPEIPYPSTYQKMILHWVCFGVDTSQ